MSDAESKEVPRPPNAFPEAVGSGKPKVASIPQSNARPASRRNRPAPARAEAGPRETLSQDALEAARVLKRKHRAYYDTDPKGFRAL